MTTVVAVGAQWGDEGKGKIVDWLGPRADLVARFQGGNNAGHTLVVDGETTILHVVPSGVLHDGSVKLIGPGVVVDPAILLAGPEATRRAAKELLRKVPASGHIVNLGHGILPPTPLESVHALVEVVHGEASSVPRSSPRPFAKRSP